MILRIKFTNDGIKFIDYYTLPPDVIDCIDTIVHYSKFVSRIKEDEINVSYYKMFHLLYLLNTKFDLLIKRG